MSTSYTLGTIASENSSSAEISNAHFQSVLVSKYAFQDSESRLEQGTVFDDGMDALGVSSIRFPGGTEAWDGSFDFRNPDDVAKLHDVLDYCASQNIGMQFTVPVRWFATEELDADGNRIAYISDEDAQALSKFIEEDLLGYATSLGVPIENIKLGNEFLASANGDEHGLDLSPLTPEEYGAAASAVAIIVGESLANFSDNNPLAEFTTPPDIVLEMPLWTGGIDRMLEYFDTDASQYISAIDTHGTHMSLEASLDELLGTNANETWYDDMPVADRLELLISHMNDSSAEYGFGELTYLNEAWAVDKAGLDHLAQAILTFHAMSVSGVESATLWTAFSGGDFTTTSAAFTDNNGGRTRMLGELFTEMQSHLVGLTAVDLNTGLTPAEELESGFIVRAFIDEDGRAVVYIANLGENSMEVDIDLTEFLSSIPGFSEGLADIEALKFGAANGAFDSFYKSSDMELFDSDYLGIDPVVDGVTLGAYEVLQVSLTASGEFASQLGDEINVEGDEDAWIIAYEGDDNITTGNGADRIDAGDGSDTIFSNGGFDTITAGAGNDIVWGGYGQDVVYLGDGDDVFYDEANQTNQWGDDFVDGGDGNDLIYGSGGADTLYGGNGNDYIEGGSQDDII
ncbi:MAG: hypothetical protein HWE33_16430, partial [Rhodobacteraceae bacterium]|nr:hypothetical protein [Paracoccaceae bacterium]